MGHEGRGTKEWRDGWVALAGATGAVGAGAALFNYAAGYFVKPLETSLGWSRTEIALGATLMMLTASIVMPFAGILVDRLGIRRLGPIAFLGYGAICLVLAAIPPVLPLYYLLLIGMALPWSGTTANVFAPLVAANFAANRGTALGIMMSGTAVLMIPLAPTLQHLIEAEGWRAGYALLGVIALLFGLPCALVTSRSTRRPPTAAGALAGGDLGLGNAMRTANYWKLLIGAAAATLAIGGFLNQLPALVSDKGLDVTEVGLIGSVFVVSVIVGRIGMGVLLDLLRPSVVSLGGMIAAAIGALLLLYPEPSFLLCAFATCLIGFAMGAEGDLQAFFVGRLFGLRAFAGIFGTLGTVSVLGMGGGSLIFGWIHDATSNYDAAIILAACLYLASGILFAMLKDSEAAEKEVSVA